MYPAYRVIWRRKPSALFEQRKVSVELDYGADFVVVCNAVSDSRKVYNNRILNSFNSTSGPTSLTFNIWCALKASAEIMTSF
jgi:hypothetical protein